MGIQDYVYRIKPASGQTAPVNELDSGQTISTTGTQTLTDRGGGDYAWAFSGGTASGAMDAASIVTTVAGNGITRALTIRVTAWGSVNQTAWAGAAETTTLTTGGMFIGVDDRVAKTLRARLNGTAFTLALGSRGDGVDVTIVHRMSTNFSGSNEQHAAWIQGASHSGTTPDVSSTATSVGSPYTLDTIVYAAVNSATFQVVDDVWWYEALSDADCLALAEDLRGSLDPSTAPTGTVTISSAEAASGTTATISYSYDAADQSGFEYRLDGGSWASIGASPATITGLSAATEYEIEVRAINGIGGGTASSPASFGTWNTFTGGAEIGNETVEPPAPSPSPSPSPSQTYGTHPWLYPPRERPKRQTEEVEEEVASQPTPAPKPVEEKPVSRTDTAGYVDPDAKAYSDFLTSKLIAAVTAQESARKIAQKARSAKILADEKRLESAELAELIRQAEIELIAAVEEERRIKQEIQDFDVAYVMAMLAEA